MNNENYGLLLNPSIKLHRQYFKEMVKLLGIIVKYRAPLPDKHWTNYAEIKSNYMEPIDVGCIFDEYPTQQTLKKLGWVSELQENASLIHVPYDTPFIQQGALFEIPSGLDHAPSRLFRVTKLTNTIVYPASVTCEIVPEFTDTFDPSLFTHEHDSFNILEKEYDEI